jgi:hypothetical protein
MHKDGELSITVIVVLILALMVLAVLVIAFRSQISGLFSSFTSLIKGTNESVSNINLNSLGK